LLGRRTTTLIETAWQPESKSDFPEAFDESLMSERASPA
jgi:hypothetical protein